MEIKWKQPIPLQSQPNQILKPSQNRVMVSLVMCPISPRVPHSFCLNPPLFTNPSLPYSQQMVSLSLINN